MRGFQTAVQRARERAEAQPARQANKERSRLNRNATRRYRRQNPDLWAAEQTRRPELRSRREPEPDPLSEPDQQPCGPGRLVRVAGGFNW